MSVPERKPYHFEPPDVSDLTSERLLDDRLRAAIARLEALPSNAPGTEKGLVERVLADHLDELRLVVRVR